MILRVRTVQMMSLLISLSSCNTSSVIDGAFDFLNKKSGISLDYNTKGEYYCIPRNDLILNEYLKFPGVGDFYRLKKVNYSENDLFSFEGGVSKEVIILHGVGKRNLVASNVSGKYSYMIRIVKCKEIFEDRWPIKGIEIEAQGHL